MIPNHKQFTKNMKNIVLLISVLTLIATSGCLVSEGGGHRHGGYERRSAVIVGPPVIVVRPPEVIIR